MLQLFKKLFETTNQDMLNKVHNRLNEMNMYLTKSYTLHNFLRKKTSYQEFQETYQAFIGLDKIGVDIREGCQLLLNDIKLVDKL